MKSKYTVIYTHRWQQGSHHHALTRMARVEVECDDTNRFRRLADAVDSDDIQYIFEGWPRQCGEQDEDIKAT